MLWAKKLHLSILNPLSIRTFIFQYARKTSSITRELSGNQFVIGDSEDESSEEEGDQIK